MKIKFPHLSEEYTEQQLLNLIEKRVKKNLRNKRFKPKKTIFLRKENSLEFEFALFLLKKIYSSFKIKTSRIRGFKPSSLDEQAHLFLNSFIKNKKFNYQKRIYFPENVLLEEMIALKKFYNPVMKIRFEQSWFLKDINAKFPQTNFSLSNMRDYILGEKQI